MKRIPSLLLSSIIAIYVSAAPDISGAAEFFPTDKESLVRWFAHEAAEMGGPSFEPDAVMDGLAENIADLQLKSYLIDRTFDLDKSKLDFFAETNGVYTPHIIPFLAIADSKGAWIKAAQEFLAAYWKEGVHQRAGVALLREEKRKISMIAVMISDQPVFLQKLPRKMLPAPFTIKVSGSVSPPYGNPRLFLKGPSGNPRPQPIKRDEKGVFSIDVSVESAGTYRLEIMVDGPKGPQIGALATLYCMVEPPHNPIEKLAPRLKYIDIASEEQVLAAMNSLRREKGLMPLTRDMRLDVAAKEQLSAMIKNRDATHRATGKALQERLNDAKIPFSFAGENVAFAETLGLAYESMLNSPAHLAAITNPRFTKVGVAAMGETKTGYYLVAIFTAPKESAGAIQSDISRIIQEISMLRKKAGLNLVEEDREMTAIAHRIMEAVNDGQGPAKPLPQELAAELLGEQERIEGMEIVTIKAGRPVEFTSEAIRANKVYFIGVSVKPLFDKTGNLGAIVYATK